MSDLERDLREFEHNISTALSKQGVKLECRKYGSKPGQKYSLRAPKTFAWIVKKPRLDCLAVSTKQEWAEKASLDDYVLKPKSEWGGPGAHWRIPEGDVGGLLNIAKYMIRVRNARHGASGNTREMSRGRVGQATGKDMEALIKDADRVRKDAMDCWRKALDRSILVENVSQDVLIRLAMSAVEAAFWAERKADELQAKFAARNDVTDEVTYLNRVVSWIRTGLSMLAASQ